MTFDDRVPAGAAVWITAAWANRRGGIETHAHAVTTNLPGGAAMPPANRRRAA